VENKERWMDLCAQASKEQDPERLSQLVQEINNLLEEKEARLKESRLALRVDTSEGQEGRKEQPRPKAFAKGWAFPNADSVGSSGG
jgi:hypothetical protein